MTLATTAMNNSASVKSDDAVSLFFVTWEKGYSRVLRLAAVTGRLERTNGLLSDLIEWLNSEEIISLFDLLQQRED
jgi:phage replication-related protein YjqB (UPF0714/DUF867 family)